MTRDQSIVPPDNDIDHDWSLLLIRCGPGSRVIEALASGIPIVNAALTAQGLPQAHFIDAGIRFTAIVRHPAGEVVAPALTTTQARIYEALLDGPRAVSDLEASLTLTGPTIRKALRVLGRQNLVHQHGGRGRHTTYTRTDTLPEPRHADAG